jgi:hypothetical protein
MFSASVWGDVWGPEVSLFDVSGGGKRGEDGESDFLVWELPHELAKGDRLVFCFEEGHISLPKGKLFEPPAKAPEQTLEASFPPTAEDIANLEARPSINSDLNWTFKINQAPPISVAPDSARQHVSLKMSWNEARPQRLRVNLTKSSLREIVDRTVGEELFVEYVPLGTSFEIAVGG